MTIFPLRLRSNLNRNRRFTVRLDSSLLDRESGFFIEEHFSEILNLEKKRSERSGRQFMLMLLNVENLLRNINEGEVVRKISYALFTSTRETDIKGWYRHKSVIGIILTDIRPIDKDFVKEKVFRKVYKSLCKVLDLELLSLIEVSLQHYPEIRSSQKLAFPLRAKPAHESRGTILRMTRPDQAARSQTRPGQESNTFTSKFLGDTKQVWLLLTGDLLLILIASLLSSYARLHQPVNAVSIYTGATVLSFTIYPMALYIFDMYNPERIFQSRETIPRTLYAVMLGGFLLAFFFYAIPQWQFGRGIMVLQMALTWVSMTGWRILYGLSFQVTVPKAGALILGAGECGKAIYPILDSPLSPYEVKGFLDDDPGKQGQVLGSAAILGTVEHLVEIANQTWAKTAILAITHNRGSGLFRTILEARLQGMEIIEMPAVYERLTGRVPIEHIEDQWFLFTDGFNLLSRDLVQKLKRLVDLSVSGILLFCTTPLMAITAAAIRLDSHGPVFYRQTRVGKGGRIFSVMKFRSMHQDAERHGAVWAEKNDPRVTRVGRWIRFARIDELPQLLNVFKGEMSLVGPRPERPEFVEELEQKIPYYFVRHSVQPGITGWAQVNYPYGASIEDAQRKLEYDLYYIKNMSLLFDIKILLRTIGVVLLGEGSR